MKTGNILRTTALNQIKEYEEKSLSLDKIYAELFNSLIRTDFNLLNCSQTIEKIFHKKMIEFVAIDGTEYSKQLFDLMCFYAGAYCCVGNIEFLNNKVKVKYKNKFFDHGKDISSCVPIYVNKIPEIDHVFHDDDGHVNMFKSISEKNIINNTNIANNIMTFSEFYLAYKFASTKEYNIIFMDRSLSNMYSSLIYDTSNRKIWPANCSLLNIDICNENIDINDLTIARHNIINKKLNLPSSRGDYLRYAIINILRKQKDKINIDQIINLLEIKDRNSKIKTRITKYLKESIKEGIIEETHNKYKLREKYTNTESRIKDLVELLGEKIFHEENEPFIITYANGRKKWLTTLDLSFLTLFTFNMLISECWKNNILLIGITKDTTAQEFKNHVIPVCIKNKLWKDNENIIRNNLDKLPKTDKMLLQSMSIQNYDKINVPWSIIEYDAAFTTAIPDLKNRNGYVSGAIKNKITQSKLFLRSFIQLDCLRKDKKLRSNVLAIDRLVYPDIDLKKKNTVNFKHEYGSNEDIDFLLFRNKSCKNELQNILLILLKAMSSSNIGEIFGYNKPLFIADKIAKWNNEEFRKIVDSTNYMIMMNKDLKNFVYYMNTFREQRRIFESNRRTSS
ncbi:MAG: hypothetical protein ACPKPY_02605 [Nitrososphaeraceae archaeon]